MIDHLVIMNQGTDRVRGQPEFRPAAAVASGDRLHLVRQPNLGVPGDFACDARIRIERRFRCATCYS